MRHSRVAGRQPQLGMLHGLLAQLHTCSASLCSCKRKHVGNTWPAQQTRHAHGRHQQHACMRANGMPCLSATAPPPGYLQSSTGGVTDIGPDGFQTQHVFRYTAATKQWASVFTNKYQKIPGRPVTDYVASISASSGKMLWANWDGEARLGSASRGCELEWPILPVPSFTCCPSLLQTIVSPRCNAQQLRACCFLPAGRDEKTGVPVRGRVTVFDGTSWKVARQSAANEDARVTGVPPNRAWLMYDNYNTSVSEVLYYNGAKWEKKASGGSAGGF